MSILADENWNRLAQMQKYLTTYKVSETLICLFNYFDKDDFETYIGEYIENNYPQFAKFFYEAVENIKNIQSDTDDNIFTKYFEDAVKKHAKGEPLKP